MVFCLARCAVFIRLADGWSTAWLIGITLGGFIHAVETNVEEKFRIKEKSMDLDYWEKFYQQASPTEQPSDFARFCSAKYNDKVGLVFDVGCGNGRDTLFFSSSSIPCAGIDQCSFATEKNRQKNRDLGLKSEFYKADFTKCDYDNLAASRDYSIYSRFTLHAINYDEERQFFDHIQSCVNLKYIFIEARTIRDSLYGVGKNVGPHEFVTTHYRRFIDTKVLKLKLEENFSIEYFEESLGFAKTGTEDPCLIRVIAKKN